MKKVLKILGVVIILLIAAIVILPIAFKGRIMQTVKDQANNNVNAVIDFDENIKLSLIKSFPKFYLEINNLSVANKAPFEGDTLASIGSMSVKLNLMKAIKGELEVKSISLDRPRIYAHVLDDTINFTANWDIAMPSESNEEEEVEVEETESSSNFSLPVKNFSITNADIVYNDELGQMLAELKGLNLEGSGDFGTEIFDMIIDLSIGQTNFKYGGVKYLNKVNTKLNAVMGMDLGQMKFTFKENTLALNGLNFNFDGFVAMPEDIMVDLKFNVPSTDFKDLISLIPAIYYKDFEFLTAKGKMNLEGEVKGTYKDDIVPAFNVSLGVENGMFKYPDLPTAVNNVQVDLNVSNPDGQLNNTIINMKKMHVELGKEPFDARLIVKNVMKDPYVDASLKGKIDLAQVKDLVELEEEVSGVINTDLSLKGYSSAIENETYDQFDASGQLTVTDLKYFYKDYNQQVEVPSMQLLFSPEIVELKTLDVKIDKNDLKASGVLQNFIPYMFDQGVLKGKLDISSNYFNLNPFLVSDESEAPVEETTADTSTYEMAVVELPENIEFYMDAQFNTLIYDELEMRKANCKLVLKDKRLQIDNLSAEVFDGKLVASGFYDTRDLNKPEVDFDMDIENFKFKELFEVSPSVQKFVPIAQYIEGDFDAQLDLNSLLGQDMMPLLESLLSNGKLSIESLAVQGFKPVDMIANTLKVKELKNLSLSNIKPSYKIKDGRFYLNEPLNFQVDQYKFEVTGSNGIDKSIDYDIKVDMPSEYLKEGGSALVSQLAGQNVDIPVGDVVTMFLKMTGTIDNPKIKTSMKDMASGVKDQIKEKVTDELNKAKQEAEEKAREELDKAKAELEAKKKAEEERIKQELEKKKQEAEEKAKKELDEQKKKAEEEAKKKLKKLFK